MTDALSHRLSLCHSSPSPPVGSALLWACMVPRLGHGLPTPSPAWLCIHLRNCTPNTTPSPSIHTGEVQGGWDCGDLREERGEGCPEGTSDSWVWWPRLPRGRFRGVGDPQVGPVRRKDRHVVSQPPGLRTHPRHRAQHSTLSLTSCVVLGKWLGLSELQFPLM